VNPVLSAIVANSSANTAGFNRAESSYTFFSTTNAGQYANSESEITSAQLVQGVPTNTNSISEVNITGTGSASANTSVTSSTLLNFTFELASLGTLDLDFLADPDLYAAINGVNVISAGAEAGTTATITLTYLAPIPGPVIPIPVGVERNAKLTWSPNGAAGGCSVDAGLIGVTCTGEVDSENLNTGVSTLADVFGGNPSFDGLSDSRIASSPDGGLKTFSITANNLFAGRWTLKLDTTTTASVNADIAQIPEPGMMALMGIGLMGLGMSARRNKKFS
jgi:hypothetical protein